MMILDHHLSRTAPAAAGPSFLLNTWTGIDLWIRACGQAYTTYAMYQELSRLSDAELNRRGLNRAELARDVFLTRDRGD